MLAIHPTLTRALEDRAPHLFGAETATQTPPALLTRTLTGTMSGCAGVPGESWAAWRRSVRKSASVLYRSAELDLSRRRRYQPPGCWMSTLSTVE